MLLIPNKIVASCISGGCILYGISGTPRPYRVVLLLFLVLDESDVLDCDLGGGGDFGRAVGVDEGTVADGDAVDAVEPLES